MLIYLSERLLLIILLITAVNTLLTVQSNLKLKFKIWAVYAEIKIGLVFLRKKILS